MVKKPCNESNDSSSRESITLKLKPNDKYNKLFLRSLATYYAYESPVLSFVRLPLERYS